MRRALVALACTSQVAACHVTVEGEIARPGKVDRVRAPTPPTPRAPTLVLDGAGRFRFVEPLACATEETVVVHRARERSKRPAMATFVIGLIGTAAGAIALVNGYGTANDPLTYAGVAGLAVGAPLAIGPWIGLRTETEPLPDGPPIHRAGPSEPCGARVLAISHATLELRGIEVHGAVDTDGVFSVSPFQLVDAYEPAAMTALSIDAETGPTASQTPTTSRPTASGPTPQTPTKSSGPTASQAPTAAPTASQAPTALPRIATVIERGALASQAATFLANADFDATVEPMRLVPNLSAGTVRASLSSKHGAPMVRLVLPIENAGPGPSYGLRGHVAVPGHPAIDGRILYIGRVAKGAQVTRELWIPITTTAAEALRNATVEIAIELRDAHGTAPSSPVRFRGPLLVDAPR